MFAFVGTLQGTEKAEEDCENGVVAYVNELNVVTESRPVQSFFVRGACMYRISVFKFGSTYEFILVGPSELGDYYV